MSAWLLAIRFGCADETPAPVLATEATAPAEEPCPWDDAASAKSSDEDGDGYLPSDCDCDDGNGDVNPDARERCNGIDDDCDGFVDEDVLKAEYFDGDGDGYGDPDTTALFCELADGYVWVAGDCDDSDSAISPDAVERCDGLDNNCDGVTDEGGLCR